MGKTRSDPLKEVNFQCHGCRHRFSAEPSEVLSAPDYPEHPWAYSVACPECGEPAGQVAWERNLLKAHAHATGPVTDEGKARTKFNSMKHGLRSSCTTYYPALPGKYPECAGCEHLASRGCEDYGGCLKRAELLLRHQIAFEKGDPSLLLRHRAETQAHLQALVDAMILAIAQDGGPRIKEVVWYHDKDGGFHLAKWRDERGDLHQIMELKAHPLLKPLMDFIAKNGLTLADQGMTPRAQDQHDLMAGYLEDEKGPRPAALEYQQRMEEGQRRLLQLIGNSYGDREPITVDAEVVDDD